MDKRAVVLYMNNTLRVGYGQVTMSDCNYMSAHIKKRTRTYISPEDIINAFLNSPVQMVEKYKSGFYHALINDYKIEVLTNGNMSINGTNGKQIIGYR